MKNIRTLSAVVLTAIASMSALSVSAGAESGANYAVSRRSATAIVNEWYEDAVEAVREGDKASFYELYDSSWTASQLNSEWNAFEQRFCGDKEYEYDAEALSFTKNEINLSVFYYYNQTDHNNKETCSTENNTINNLGLKNYNGEWKLFNGSFSNEIQKNTRDAKIALFGKNAYYNGFCSGNYQMEYGKALAAGMNVDVKTAVINKNGSMTLVLGFANGLNEAKTITSLTGTISFGKDRNSTKQAVDLSSLKLSNVKVPAGSVKYVTVTVKKSELLNTFTDNAELAHCSNDIHTTFRKA